MTRKSLIINSIIPLFIGFVYYALFRNGSYIFSIVHRFADLPIPKVVIPEIINNHLCDCLWGYSLYMILYLVTSDKLRAMFFSVIFIILLEIVQIGMRSMTFDILDILFELISIIIASILVHIITERGEKNEKKEFNH